MKSETMNKERLMNNEQGSMINDLWKIIDEQSAINDEQWTRINDQWLMINKNKWWTMSD